MAESSVIVILSGDASYGGSISRERPLTLGASADVRLTDPHASPLHCRLVLGARGLELVDLGSAFGTYVNDRRVVRAPLQTGDRIQIGQARLEVRIGVPGDSGRAPLVETSPPVELSEEDARVQRIVDKLQAEGFRAVRVRSSAPPLFHLTARRPPLNQRLSLKVLDTGGVPAEAAERFLREAKITASLSHPNVVKLIDARRYGSLLVMLLEPLEGRTVQEEVVQNGRFEPRRSMLVAVPVARALSYAHAKGVIHRDLTPSTVWLTDIDDVKLIDFGLAKIAKSLKKKNLTGPRRALGAPGFAAPEQLAEGSAATELSDVFSFGSLLYFMLSGASPFPDREDFEGSGQRARSLREAAPDMPDRLIYVVDRCLEPRPERRFGSAQDLMVAVEDCAREVLGLKRHSSGVDLVLSLTAHERVVGPASIPLRSLVQLGHGLPTLVGSYSATELIEILQLCEQHMKSGRFDMVDEEGRDGEVVFREGRVIRARCAGLSGEDAMRRILRSERGHMRFVVRDVPGQAEHDLAVSPLILELMRVRDEETGRFAMPPGGFRRDSTGDPDADELGIA